MNTMCEAELDAESALESDAHLWEELQRLSVESSLLERFIVEPGARVDLGRIDPSYCAEMDSYEAVQEEMRSCASRLDRLQYLMHAERKRSLLVVLQGLDACGKDGVARHILTSMNPAGCRVVGFRQPTREELRHDFLWRVHPHVPGKGEIVVFNRSHYEDVLVVRVHELAPVSVWSKRYEQINDFEKFLALDSNTTILKFLLYISKEEQLARFKRRLDDPTRRCKISESDYQERKYWDQYMQAFEDRLAKTSTRHAPWFVIPANHKWFRDLAVSQIVARTLENLDMELPEAAVDIARIRRQYHAAEAEGQAA